MKNLLIAAMLGSTALAGTALAQDTSVPSANSQTSTPEGDFITWQGPDQMIASNVIGANVVGPEDEVIGSVDDLLLDKKGEVIGVLVGIGGFLGIGERNIAIPDAKLEYVLARDAGAMDGATGTTGDPAMVPGQGGMDGTGAGSTPGQGNMAGDQNSAMDNSAMDNGTAANLGQGVVEPSARGMANWTGSMIDHIRVSYTRAELEDAPAFEAATQ